MGGPSPRSAAGRRRRASRHCRSGCTAHLRDHRTSTGRVRAGQRREIAPACRGRPSTGRSRAGRRSGQPGALPSSGAQRSPTRRPARALRRREPQVLRAASGGHLVPRHRRRDPVLRPGAQGVRRHGGLRGVVLAPVDEDLAAAQVLRHPGDDQVRCSCSRRSASVLAYAEVRSSDAGTIDALTCIPFDPLVLASGTSPSASTRSLSSRLPPRTPPRSPASRGPGRAPAGSTRGPHPAARPSTAARAARAPRGWRPRPAWAGPRRRRSRWSPGSWCCRHRQANGTHPVGRAGGAFLAKNPLPATPSGKRWKDIGRSAMCGSRTGATRA